MAEAPRRHPQPPIADYAMIGDCHGAALVSSRGSIDWCTQLRFDADPVFFRLLDGRGGSWDVEPDRVERVSRRYLHRTNILRTRFETATGTLEVTDFMPVGRRRTATAHDYVSLSAPGWLVRRFACVEGSVSFETAVRPRGPGFAIDPLDARIGPGRISFDGGLALWCDGEARRTGDGAAVRLELREGECETLVLTRVDPLFDPRDRADELFGITHAFWYEWTEYSRYRGAYEEAVWRSALALKLLTFAPTGAVVAAATTSLPETPGGARNWDYRFCWIRDTTFALLALSVLGYGGEGRRFSDYLTRRCLREGSTMRIMYNIDGELFMPEREIDHLEGYRGARPVRVGNRAAEQRQIDVFGEVLDWAELRAVLGQDLTPDDRALVSGIAGHVCGVWREPDRSLWEVRAEARHYTQGKAMAWVTLDRAARLVGDRPAWKRARDEIMAAIETEACAGSPPYLAQFFGGTRTDAALLQLPLLGLPLDDGLLRRTVQRIEHDLRDGDHVYRYRGGDGLEGDEGAFFVTSFWLVEALLCLDRGEEARALFERLLGDANDVGLYAEQADPGTGEFLGNFPQAFTHMSLISSAALLYLYDRHGAKALSGTNADRARRMVGATEGLKGLFYAILRNKGVRLRSSRKSVLALT